MQPRQSRKMEGTESNVNPRGELRPALARGTVKACSVKADLTAQEPAGADGNWRFFFSPREGQAPVESPRLFGGVMMFSYNIKEYPAPPPVLMYFSKKWKGTNTSFL